MNAPLTESRTEAGARALHNVGCGVLQHLMQAGYPSETSKDAVQEALLRWIARPLPSADEPLVRAWVLTTAERCLWRDRHRTALLTPLAEHDLSLEDEIPLEQRVLIREILDACATGILTRRTYESIRRWSLGHLAEVVARDLGLTAAAVRQKTHRGLELLRHWFRDS